MATPVVGVDVGGLKDLAKALRQADTALSKNLKVQMKQVGQKVAATARTNASWSSRIPASIKVTVTGNGSRVAVKAGGPAAPHAAALEGKGTSTFRHPVFGHRKVWVSQKTRPYLVPALQQDLDAITEMVAEAIDGILK